MFVAGHVVVPEEMEKTVNHEMGNLAGERPPGGTRLNACGFEGDIDFPQKYRRRGIDEGSRLAERERENVGRLVRFAIVAIQPADEMIPREDNRDRRPRTAESPEGGADQRPKSGQS